MIKLLLIAIFIFALASISLQNNRQPKQQYSLVYIQNQQPVAPADINWPFSICGYGFWVIQQLTLSAVPVKNAIVSVRVVGLATQDFNFKEVTISYMYEIFPLHSQVVQFATSFRKGDTVQFKRAFTIPALSPPGNYKATFSFLNEKGISANCFSFVYKI